MKTTSPSKASASRSNAAIIYLSLGAAMLASVSTGVYLLSGHATTDPTTLQAGVQTPTPARENTAADISHSKQIELAMSAYNAGKLVTPAGENALELYLAALQSKPNDFGAQEAVMELVPLAMTALESAMAANTSAEVERLIAVLERADPSAARVAALKQRWLANVAQQANAVAAASNLETLQPEHSITVQEIPAPEIAAAPVPTVASAVVPAAPVALVRTEKQTPLVQESPQVVTAAVRNHVVEARALSTARAVFPAQARRQKIEGWVDLQVVVAADGRVTEALVVGAQPARIFDVEARRAALRWRYSPKRVNDQPVSSVLRQRIKFSLTS